MRRRSTLLVLALALLFGCAACGTARRSELILGRVVASDPEYAAGRHFFAEHCHTCHPGGEAGLGPALNNKPLPQFLIKFQVRHGLGAMPAFSEEHLNASELDAVAGYVAALRRAE